MKEEVKLSGIVPINKRQNLSEPSTSEDISHLETIEKAKLLLVSKTVKEVYRIVEGKILYSTLSSMKQEVWQCINPNKPIPRRNFHKSPHNDESKTIIKKRYSEKVRKKIWDLLEEYTPEEVYSACEGLIPKRTLRYWKSIIRRRASNLLSSVNS